MRPHSANLWRRTQTTNSPETAINDTTRKLATIVALDVAGYSARTEADEARTTAEVAALRKVIEAIAAKHGGRVFNTAGDGFMLEFGSSLAAVEAAGELASTCEPKVRVGVHLGDVVVQPNGDLLGHGVNVAARLMAKSEPGGALVSADVRRTIRGPLGERLFSRGVMQLDKMAETIEAFALRIVTATPAAPDVFLSYARDDQAVARKFAEALEREGLAVWWDVALRSGDAYHETMEQALKAAKSVVVLWSKKSVESRWVRTEATLADRNKTLIPCMIEPCERPIMFELTQTVELAHWQGDAADKPWLAFLGDVKRLVAKEEGLIVEAVTPTLAPPPMHATLKSGQTGSAPSLAVLPFTNRSHLPEDDVFAEGMVEDVISALSQGVNVRVLGSTATANLSRAAITDLAAVGHQLGVRYLLEGNVRRAGANLRVTTQLLDAATGEVVWTGKFDRPLSELAGLQEELVTEVAASLDAQVYSLELERALKKPGDITAWQAVARAMSPYRRHVLSDRERAIEEARRAVAISPDYAPGHAMLARALATSYLFDKPDDPTLVEDIRAVADRGLGLAPDDAAVLSYVGVALCFIGYPDEGVRHTDRAVRKAPGSGLLHYQHGIACVILKRPEEAVSHLNTAARLSPGWHLMWAVKAWESWLLGALGRWAEADAAVNESITLNPIFGFNHASKALYCIQLGQHDETRRQVETARRQGCDSAQAQRLWRRLNLNSPRLETDIASMRSLYVAQESGA